MVSGCANAIPGSTACPAAAMLFNIDSGFSAVRTPNPACRHGTCQNGIGISGRAFPGFRVLRIHLRFEIDCVSYFVRFFHSFLPWGDCSGGLWA
ncbi:MAG: hypothetical protein ACRD3D_15020, partial [Terriglobia bacterium]